jgi:hypothetical protein
MVFTIHINYNNGTDYQYAYPLNICFPYEKPKIFIDHVIELIRLVQKIEVVVRAVTVFASKIVSTPHHARQTLD